MKKFIRLNDLTGLAPFIAVDSIVRFYEEGDGSTIEYVLDGLCTMVVKEDPDDVWTLILEAQQCELKTS